MLLAQRLHLARVCGEADDGEGRQRKPEWGDDAAGALGEFARGMDTGLPVSPQRQKKVTGCVEWNATQHVSGM
jgi:hypothetical protein